MSFSPLPSIDMRLAPGWRLDETSRVIYRDEIKTKAGDNGEFVEDSAASYSLGDVLPPNARVVPTVRSLSTRGTQDLTEDEEQLLRSLKVIFQRDTNVSEYLDALSSIPAIEKVSLPPAVSLP